MHFNSPLTNIPILFESASASAIVWVVRTTDAYFFSYETLEIISHILCLASGSIPVEGSSSKRIGGFPIIAYATINFLLFPPLYDPATLS